MAYSKQLNFAFAVLGMVLPAMAMATATEFTVGDDSGWTLDFDYDTWAKDKVFRVGDTLVFKYTEGRHNVFKVNGTAFGSCSVPAPSEGLTSGNDVITLSSLGRKWYICGVSDHCAQHGMKLAITVLEEGSGSKPAPALAPAPAPSTPGKAIGAPPTSTPIAPSPNSAYAISLSRYTNQFLVMAAMVALAAFL